jgi:hypothetical protein
MLDPHVRTALKPAEGRPGVYETVMRVPDRHGVFKFVVDYRRKGYVLKLLFCLLDINVLSQMDKSLFGNHGPCCTTST